MTHEIRHESTRHGAKNRPRKPVKIKFGHIVAVVVALLVLWYVWDKLSPQTPEYDYGSFAQCLTEKGATMYGAYWCSHCKAQKEDFGDAFQYVNYVECTDDPDACTLAGVQGFPSWVIGGELYSGRQSFSRLSSLTGCELPSE